MTTIATDGRTIAADGLVVSGNDVVVAFGRTKLVRLADGSILGFAGTAVEQEVFAAWLNDGGKRPKLGAFEALRLMNDGSLLRYAQVLDPLPAEFPAAVGSGSDLALGAMLAGVSPQQAVEIAASRDIATGGTIAVMSHNHGV